MYFTHHPIEFEQFVAQKIGEERFQALKTRALQYGKIDHELIYQQLSVLASRIVGG